MKKTYVYKVYRGELKGMTVESYCSNEVYSVLTCFDLEGATYLIPSDYLECIRLPIEEEITQYEQNRTDNSESDKEYI